jgi:hypothetical protein
MTVPAATQPNIQPGLSNQIHIALNLFDTILKTANMFALFSSMCEQKVSAYMPSWALLVMTAVW